MRIASSRFAFWLSFLLPATAAHGQANDGFQRRDGRMYVVRNGETRPLTRDTRLPNGRLVTRDGFVVARDGGRTELREGEGCSLLGVPTAVRTRPDGRLLLSASGGPAGSPPPPARYEEAMRRWFGPPGRGHGKAKGKHKHKHRD